MRETGYRFGIFTIGWANFFTEINTIKRLFKKLINQLLSTKIKLLKTII